MSSSAETIGDLFTLQWSTAESANTSSVAWGDYDNDGDLDLVVGNIQQPTRLYRTDNGHLSVVAWETEEILTTQSVAWGDYDNDGDLDLAIGIYDKPNRIYRNENGTFTIDTRWNPTADYTQSIAWGDIDGDGDLDLAVGNGCRKFDTITCSHNVFYRNTGDGLESSVDWSAETTENTLGLAWGDYNSDGDLDLVVSTVNGIVRLYVGDGYTLNQSAVWSKQVGGAATSVAWGDYDNDDDLDLAVSTVRATNQIYRNDAGILSDTPVWRSSDRIETRNLVWGDYDSDGDLDLAAGNGGELNEPNSLYRNDNGTLTTQPIWRSNLADKTTVVAWGDIDGDGDLDLASGNLQGPSRLYRNEISTLSTIPFSLDQNGGQITGLAWGDIDGDNDIDLVAANSYGSNILYRNELGVLTRSWESTDENFARGLALGDYDGDGDLDLAIAEAFNGSSKIYRNNSGIFSTSPVWIAPDTDRASSVAWGDYDNDGDLDLAVGTFSTLDLPEQGQVNRIYRNNGNNHFVEAWTSDESEMTIAVAWGDVDNDGDLDLITGNGCPIFATSCAPNRLYLNERGTLASRAVWSSTERDRTTSVSWGDYDGDGDLDLATGNIDQPVRLYRNNGGILGATAVWSSIESASVSQVSWADYDNDGDLDLTAISFGQPSRIYRNDQGYLTTNTTWFNTINDTGTSAAWGDFDKDGDLDLATASRDDPIRIYRNAHSQIASPASIPVAQLHYPTPPDPGNSFPITILSGGTVTISYTLSHFQSVPAAKIAGFYSLDGGGRWFSAQPTLTTKITNLATSPAGTSHIYTWDIFKSGVMGQSDTVIFRLVVWPTLTTLKGATPGPFHYGAFATQTNLFRIRGTQVQVLRKDGVSPEQVAMGAFVYRISRSTNNNNGEVLGSADGVPFRTDSQGYLQGRTNLVIGDQLVALMPISTTKKSTLYATSAEPTLYGLNSTPVTTQGIQVLRVSEENPLLVFSIDVSLEWDARPDQIYLDQLTHNLQRTSELLYDWSNGQVALGEIRIFLNREQWEQSDVRIVASNRVRPTANQGGIVDQDTIDPIALDRSIIYTPGHVTIGAVWNRYGDPADVVGEDWSRALAHELGHYLLFLDDNYLGLDNQGLLIPIDGCPGAMSDPYRIDNSEFYPSRGWGNADGHPNCIHTLSHHTTGRSDWATITTFYPQLRAPTQLFGEQNSGPTSQPLALTQVHIIQPTTEKPALEPSTLTIINANDGSRILPGLNTRAVLFQSDQNQLIDLGQPILDRVDARGARIGDRVCVYDLDNSMLGCTEVSYEEQQIPVYQLPQLSWQPQITFTPVTSRTLSITVANVPTGLLLWAKVYPDIGEATEPVRLVTELSSGYSGTVLLQQPAYTGHIHLWVEEAELQREALVSYAVGGNPGHVRSRKTPIVSSDGQVVLYTDNLAIDRNTVYALQTVPALSNIPSWANLVGQGIRLVTIGDVDFTNTSISFNYLGSDVSSSGEEWLRIYFWNGEIWVPLETVRNNYYNIATASIANTGPGLYALMSSVEISIPYTGWNLISYPIYKTQPITDALASINGDYSIVYEYTPKSVGGVWHVYSPDAPHWLLNDPEVGITKFTFSKGYWIYMRRPARWFPGQMKQRDLNEVVSTPNSIPSPPATFYGSIVADANFMPMEGMVVQALSNGYLCGTGKTRVVDGEVVYIIHVLAEWQGANFGCGRAEEVITFTVDDIPMQQAAIWNNVQLSMLDLTPAQTHSITIYLPFLMYNQAAFSGIVK